MKQVILFAVCLFTGITAFAQILRPVKMATPAAGGACCGFRAYNSDEIPMSLGQTKENTVVFDKEVFDDANSFNGAAYKTSVAGVYQFSVCLGIKAKNTSSSINQLMLILKAGSQQTSQLINIPGNYENIISGQITTTVKLAAGEDVSVVVIGLGTAQAATTGNLSYFSGVKLY